MAKLTMKNTNAKTTVATPVGRLMWCNLANPRPMDAPMQADKYTCTVAWDKDDATQAVAIKGLVDAVEKVARQAFGDETLTLKDLVGIQSIIKNGNDMQTYLNGLMVTPASTGSKYPPKVYGPVMSEGVLSKEDISKISNGDYGRMVITVASYKTPAKAGITAYLSIVQFARRGESLGGTNSGNNLLGDLDVLGAESDATLLSKAQPLQDEDTKKSTKTIKKDEELSSLADVFGL